MPPPSWLTAIKWSNPQAFEDLRDNHGLIPEYKGVYAFTKHNQPDLHDGLGVLYVGQTSKQTLRERLSGYLLYPGQMPVFSKKYGPPKQASGLNHAGKNLLLMEVQQLSREGARCGIWIRWTQHDDPVSLEANLIRYLQPAFNTQGL